MWLGLLAGYSEWLATYYSEYSYSGVAAPSTTRTTTRTTASRHWQMTVAPRKILLDNFFSCFFSGVVLTPPSNPSLQTNYLYDGNLQREMSLFRDTTSTVHCRLRMTLQVGLQVYCRQWCSSRYSTHLWWYESRWVNGSLGLLDDGHAVLRLQ